MWLAFWTASIDAVGSCPGFHPQEPSSPSWQGCCWWILLVFCTHVWDCPDPGAACTWTCWTILFLWTLFSSLSRCWLGDRIQNHFLLEGKDYPFTVMLIPLPFNWDCICLSICVCCKLFCLLLCCKNEERMESIRHKSLLKEWMLSGYTVEALMIFMFGYTNCCIFR